MQFNNYAEQKEHPYARLVPKNITTNIGSYWNSGSLSLGSRGGLVIEFPDELLFFIQTIQNNPSSLSAFVEENQTALKINNKKAGLLIALLYPDLDSQLLYQILVLLDLQDVLFFNICVEAGNTRLIQVLAAVHAGTPWIQEMIRANSYKAFRKAASHGHLSILCYFKKELPDEFENMIETYHYESYREAASRGHLPIVRYLGEQIPHKKQEMISADSNGSPWAAPSEYDAFRQAAAHGHLDVLRYLAEQAPDRLQEMIAKRRYYAFREAASNGHLDVLRYLEEQAPDKLADMISSGDYFSYSYYAFCKAASNGNLNVLYYLAEKAADKLQEMVAANDYHAFRLAASGGHLAVLQYLAEQAPHRLEEMITVCDHDAFRYAASNGHLEVLHYLAEQVPHRLQEMIAANNYYPFHLAASYGHLSVLNYLIEQAPYMLPVMISADNYYPIRWASEHGQGEVMNLLLFHPDAFAYAELHEHEYARYTLPFIEKQLNILREKKADSEEALIFTPQEARWLFYLARALIRRGALQDDLRLILEIPVVRELAHQAVTRGHANELLRLAARLGDQEICNYLLTIPGIQREAEANNFYINEGDSDLALLARDRESSMIALSYAESQCLDSLKDYYLQQDERSPNQIIDELRRWLRTRYEKNPANIMTLDLSGKMVSLALPITWEEFISLPLSEEEKKTALEAYYKNKTHTAWRFLAKPNFWVSRNATYVNWGSLGAWSCFEPYEELIAILFLAAKDENTTGVDGYKIEDRMVLFIDELALIQRAHNWDGEDNNLSEYDDLKGDKPSCFSGIKRRLFQSVQGHPLLKQLTPDILRQELREFVWCHFQEMITKDNHLSLCTIWQKSIEIHPFTEEEKAILSTIDISKEKQGVWIETLRAKYGKQLDHYETFLLRMLKLSDQESHFIHFGYLGLDQMLRMGAFQKNDSLDILDSSLVSNINSLSKGVNTSVRFFNLPGNWQDNSKNFTFSDYHPMQ